MQMPTYLCMEKSLGSFREDLFLAVVSTDDSQQKEVKNISSHVLSCALI